MAGRNDFVDERRPVVWPLLLEDRDKDEVEFVKESSLGLQSFFGA